MLKVKRERSKKSKRNLPTSMSALDELALLPSSVCRDLPECLSRCSSVLSVVGFESPAMNGRGNLVDSAAFGVVFPKRGFSGCPLQTFEDERNKFGSNDAVREPRASRI